MHRLVEELVSVKLGSAGHHAIILGCGEEMRPGGFGAPAGLAAIDTGVECALADFFDHE